jgi:hypothetical protein
LNKEAYIKGYLFKEALENGKIEETPITPKNTPKLKSKESIVDPPKQDKKMVGYTPPKKTDWTSRLGEIASRFRKKDNRAKEVVQPTVPLGTRG